jgi:VanZ family protein
MAVIFLASADGDPSPPVVSDKLAHFLAYGALAALAVRAAARAAWAGVTGRAVLLGICISSLYGVSDELHQSFVPGRHPEALDAAADLAGAATAAGALWAWSIIRRFLAISRPHHALRQSDPRS